MERLLTLSTEHLILRQIEIEDIPSLVKHANNAKISSRIVNIPHPYREPDATFRLAYVFKGIKNKTHYVYSIIEKSSNSFIGEVSLHLTDKARSQAQLAYWLGEAFWNKNYTTEAAKTIIDFGFNHLNLKLIYASCSLDNLASERVMQKLGMLKKSSYAKEHFYQIQASNSL